jgi:hypothetical protein
VEELIIAGMTLVGIGFLLISVSRSQQIVELLQNNIYPTGAWNVILLMLVGFALGYATLVFQVFGFITLPISTEMVVAFVYFFGAIFTVFTTGAVKQNLTGILGKIMSDDEAKIHFNNFAGISENGSNTIDLSKVYSIVCEHCTNHVNYKVTDIVKSNAVALDRGISVEDIFGTKSYILRPSHRCLEGRRETTVVHDKNLEIRSIEGSRIIYGGNL